MMYLNMDDYARAEPSLLRAIDIRKTALGEDLFDYATSLGNLGGLYLTMGEHARAEPLFHKALDRTTSLVRATSSGVAERKGLHSKSWLELAPSSLSSNSPVAQWPSDPPGAGRSTCCASKKITLSSISSRVARSIASKNSAG
jgi:hypothetical protein